jgi:hypothetical protein
LAAAEDRDGLVGEGLGSSMPISTEPSRFTVFQSKAQRLTEGIVKAEVLAKVPKPKRKRGKTKPKLKGAISEALSRRGSYVMFCSCPLIGQKIQKLRKAIEGAIRQTGSTPLRLVTIDIYDANKIADWVNTHPAVALWLTSHERRRCVAGFQSHDGWGRSADITGVPWIKERCSAIRACKPVNTRK